MPETTGPQRGLLIREPWISKVCNGEKTWELRGSRTHVRETVGLIRSGSGTIVGTADLVGVEGPLDLPTLRRTPALHGVPATDLDAPPYAKTYAWVFENALWLPQPVPYDHPSGAVIWVRLDAPTSRAVHRARRGP